LAQLAQALPDGFPSGPDDLQRLLTVFFLMFGFGFVIAVVGHVVKSRTLVGAGIALVFLGTTLFMVAVASEG
jgi:hypothetical protein